MQMYQVNTKEIKSQRLEKATENDTFISIENIFKMSSIDYINLRLDIEEVKSSFQVLINSFQRLIDNLLTHYVIKFSLNLCYMIGTMRLHVFLYSRSICLMHLN
jgi:hypothetical protein